MQLIRVQTTGCGAVTLWPDRVELSPGMIRDQNSQGSIPLNQIQDVLQTDASHLRGPGQFCILMKADPRPLEHLCVHVGAGSDETKFQALAMSIRQAIQSANVPPPVPPMPTPEPEVPPSNPQDDIIMEIRKKQGQGIYTAEQADALINKLLGINPQ